MKLPDGMASLVASNYSVLRPDAQPADMAKKPAVVPSPAAAPTMPRLNAADPFAGMKNGESRNFRSWGANQVGGMTVVGGLGTLEERQARASIDATAAGTRLNNVKSDLMPGETAASIAQMNANAGLIGQQAKWFGPTAQANIGFANANAADVRNTTDINYRTNHIPLVTADEVRQQKDGYTTAPNRVTNDVVGGAMRSLGLVKDAFGRYTFAH